MGRWRRYAADVTPARSSTAPTGIVGWLVELAEILALRHRVVVVVAGATCLLALLLALPGVLPARAMVGAAVGLGAGLLAVAVAIAVDSADTVVQGSRHVHALDGLVLGEAPAEGSDSTLGALARQILRIGRGGSVRLAVTAVSEESVSVRTWSERLARALARQPRRVMLLDPVGSPESGPGIPEVAAGEVRLGDAVRFDDELLLATLRGGDEPGQALAAVPDLLGRLPGDVEAAVVPLPPVIQPGTLEVARAVDHVLVLVERGISRRVDLLTVLDALDTTGAQSWVVLLGAEQTAVPWGDPLGGYFDASTNDRDDTVLVHRPEAGGGARRSDSSVRIRSRSPATDGQEGAPRERLDPGFSPWRPADDRDEGDPAATQGAGSGTSGDDDDLQRAGSQAPGESPGQGLEERHQDR